MKNRLICTIIALCCSALLAIPCDIHVGKTTAEIIPAESNKQAGWDVSLSSPLSFFSF